MEISKKILDKIKGKDFLTTQFLTEQGISKTTICNYVKKGLLERVRHGVYILNDSIHDEMYSLQLSSNKIVFSHETALFILGLSNRTPFIHSITIPSNSSVSKSIKNECKCFYVKPELYNLGLIEIKNTFGNFVRSYDAERTICDLLRNRSRIDEETFISAIKNYVEYKNKNLNKLAEYSKVFGLENRIKTYLEVLL